MLAGHTLPGAGTPQSGDRLELRAEAIGDRLSDAEVEAVQAGCEGGLA